MRRAISVRRVLRHAHARMSTTCYGVIIWSVADRRLHASLQFPILSPLRHTYSPVSRVLHCRLQVSLPRFTSTHLSVACFVAVSRSLSLVSHLPTCRSRASLPFAGLSPSFHTYSPVGRRQSVACFVQFSGLSPSCHTYSPTRSRLQRWQPTTAAPLPPPPWPCRPYRPVHPGTAGDHPRDDRQCQQALRPASRRAAPGPSTSWQTGPPGQSTPTGECRVMLLVHAYNNSEALRHYMGTRCYAKYSTVNRSLAD